MTRFSMIKNTKNQFEDCRGEKAISAARVDGVVLLMTLVVLVVLASLGYSLASRVAAQRHRDNYIIDYTKACYARDSAVKYALATLQDLNDIEYVSRPNEPDFSDLFALDEEQYRGLLEEWAEQLGISQAELFPDMEKSGGYQKDDNLGVWPDYNESNDVNSGYSGRPANKNDIFSRFKIRGPYGPSWPFVIEPVEFEIGSATIKIEIEDENAKYPIGWGMLSDEKTEREAQAGFDTFCEWMGMDSEQIESLKGQLQQVGSIKPFKAEFERITERKTITSRAPSNRRRGTRRRSTTYKTVVITPKEQMTKQARDFSRLFHSSIIDMEMLATPTIISESRKESALKYLGMWGTTQVNINSAPRQVLESAFTFGGDAEKIADEIIRRRREKSFEGIDELKKELFRFANSIEKCQNYIVTESNMFSIHVTASSGVAKASAVIVVIRQDDKMERIAVVSG